MSILFVVYSLVVISPWDVLGFNPSLKPLAKPCSMTRSQDCRMQSLYASSSILVDSILTSPATSPLDDLSSSVEELESQYEPTIEGRVELFGDYRVEQTFNPKDERMNNAAGGKWVRENSITGKLCKVDGLFQNIIRDDADGSTLAINLVLLSLLSRLICFTVVLKGACTFLEKEERNVIANKRETPGGLGNNVVRANFDSPMFRVSLLGYRSPLGITLRLGPRSSVILDASYCDERLRIGKGASGVKFVLRREREGWMKDMWRRVLGSRLIVGKKGVVGMIGATGGALLRGKGVVKKIFGGISIAAALVIIKSKGEIDEGEQREV